MNGYEYIETIDGARVNLCIGCSSRKQCLNGMDNCKYSDEYLNDLEYPLISAHTAGSRPAGGMPEMAEDRNMKIKGQYAPYKNHRGSCYIRIPSFVEPAEKYEIEVQENGTLVYQPVKP